jgi:hypothetical protein
MTFSIIVAGSNRGDRTFIFERRLRGTGLVSSQKPGRFFRYSLDLIAVEAFTSTPRAELTAFFEGLDYWFTNIVCLTLFFTKSAASAVSF